MRPFQPGSNPPPNPRQIEPCYDYKFLFSYLQLWRSYATSIAHPVHIIYAQNVHRRPKRILGGRTWYGISNFVRVGDNWIKICSLAWIGTCNRQVKFQLKIPNRLWKISENLSWSRHDTSRQTTIADDFSWHFFYFTLFHVRLSKDLLTYLVTEFV